MTKALALPESVLNSEGVQAFDQSIWDAIRKTSGDEVAIKAANVLSCLNSDGTLSESSSADEYNEDEDDSQAVSVRYLRLCRKTNEDLVADGVAEGDFYYKDSETGKNVSLGKSISGVVPLQVHEERNLFGHEASGYDSCKSLDAKEGGLGPCGTCLFNPIYRSKRKKAGNPFPDASIPKGMNGRPACCSLNKVLYFVFANDPGQLYNISFGKGPEIKECFSSKFMPLQNNQFQKSSYSKGRFLEFAVLKPKKTLAITAKYKKFGENSNFYLDDVKADEEIYPELRKVLWRIARVAHIYYTLRLEAARMWNQEEDEDPTMAPALEEGSAGSLPPGEEKTVDAQVVDSADEGDGEFAL